MISVKSVSIGPFQIFCSISKNFKNICLKKGFESHPPQNILIELTQKILRTEDVLKVYSKLTDKDPIKKKSCFNNLAINKLTYLFRVNLMKAAKNFVNSPYTITSRMLTRFGKHLICEGNGIIICISLTFILFRGHT